MSAPTYFDPRSTAYKRPYGAVSTGAEVWFALRPPRAEGFSRAFLRARPEFREELLTLPLPWRDSRLGRDEFSGVLDTGDYVGPLWYSLCLEGFGGRRWESEEFLLTVYDDSDPPPDWFGPGVSYQIFPDRFCKTQLAPPGAMPGRRATHARWSDTPDYLPDAQGVIGNCDFFGGTLAGVESKLDYLSGLGVETLYLCPIFEAAENHRYGTADYRAIDPMLGTREDFSRLCRAAHAKGMRVLLDGVFSHVGRVSRYFNGDGFYPDVGAAQSRSSPYYDWFDFQRWPEEYTCWWGISTLPAAKKDCPDYQRFIYEDPDSVARHWLRLGADGWRLDVADELPDEFVAGLHRAVRAEKPDGLVLGEVWEDGVTKIAYGVRRRHLLGGHLDGLMNYPLRDGLLRWLLGGDGAELRETVETLREHYPPRAFSAAMNFLGTHDTPRILTLLGVGGDLRDSTTRDWRAAHRLSPSERALGLARLKLGAMALFSLPGSPTVYYGDEAGMEGFEDPFNRRGFPWGEEDADLLDWYRALGGLRKTTPALRRGELDWGPCREGLVTFFRRAPGQTALIALNAGSQPQAIQVSWPHAEALEPLTGGACAHTGAVLPLTLPSLTGKLVLSAPARCEE